MICSRLACTLLVAIYLAGPTLFWKVTSHDPCMWILKACDQFLFTLCTHRVRYIGGWSRCSLFRSVLTVLKLLYLADFNLNASTLQPVVGDNVTLYCSSGLSKAIDVMVNFTFQAHNKTELETKQFVCNESDYHLGNKWIHRTGTAPHDCILEIIGVDEGDSGMYQCIGDLRSSGIGESEDAPSNIVNVSVITHEDTLLQAFVTIVTPVNESTQVISISIGATMFLILLALSIIGWLIRRRYYNNEQDQPYVPIGGGSIAEREGKT